MIILNNLYIQLKYQILLAYDFTYFQISQLRSSRGHPNWTRGHPNWTKLARHGHTDAQGVTRDPMS